MHATTGDLILVHGRTVGSADHHAEIIEVRGDDGAPPYLVRFEDGHESLMYPGADCEVQPAAG